MHKFRQFLEDLPVFDLVTDHKPLVPILNNYALDKLDNSRLFRLRLKMQHYSFIAAQPCSGELGEGLPWFSAKSALVGLIDVKTATHVAYINPVLEKIKQAATSDPILRKF